ncbi:vWA domain-containing protein [Acanthopleuribacter pedis]|uniref:VWA domain-containing protein n=1 Tax=Acanthopleuribacter pedis TaxID=442870 RepID=A0A8J7PZ01_9BACT|nr:vWA domain-containing protein [Acanthopleuribacter pedis]MBO1317257.1 VWA domain-containing protein [Acanthopleuribacter pedis]MBO1318564.1 VWA domain-containing protein [Acanthopleuribacter pedis]
MSDSKSATAAVLLLAGLLVIGPLVAIFFLMGDIKVGPRMQQQNDEATARQRFKEQPVMDIQIPSQGGQVSTARNLLVIFDGSGSMLEEPDASCGADGRFANKHEGAIWAVEQFVEQVPDGVNLGLYVFDQGGGGLRMALAPDREGFMAHVRAVNPGGGTPLAEAIRMSTRTLVAQYQQQLGYGEFRLVVVTDGEAQGLAKAAVYAAGMGMPIYTIGLCVDPNHVLREFSVSYTAANDFEALSAGLADSLAELPDFDDTQF